MKKGFYPGWLLVTTGSAMGLVVVIVILVVSAGIFGALTGISQLFQSLELKQILEIIVVSGLIGGVLSLKSKLIREIAEGIVYLLKHGFPTY